MQSPLDIDLKSHDPLLVIELERDCQRRICDDLERLADQLGSPLDIQLCSTLQRQLATELPLYHRDEEALFELKLQKGSGNRLLEACAGQAILQHAAMQAYTFELLEPLSDLTAGVAPRNLDTVGYMLRYCFDSIRNHLNWEDASIFQVYPQNLTDADLQHLRASMIQNRTGQT